MFHDLSKKSNPYIIKPTENLTTIYKINFDGEIYCIKKLSSDATLDKMRQQLKDDIPNNFLFCMKDKTKIMRSDEDVFKISEISYDEGHMYFVNIISVKNQPSKDDHINAKENKEVINHGNTDQINLNSIPHNNIVYNPTSVIDNPSYPSQTTNQNYDAPDVFDHKSSKKNDNPDSLLGKKKKDLEKSSLGELIKKQKLNNEDSNIQSLVKSKEVSEDKKKAKKIQPKPIDKDLDMSTMNRVELDLLMNSLDQYLMEELKDLCRANKIVYSNRTKFELIDSLTEHIINCEDALPKKNIKLNFYESETKKLRIKYMDYSKERLKNILFKHGLPYSNLNKDQLIERLIDFKLDKEIVI